MIFKFFRSKTTFTIIALKVVTCTPTFARVTEPAPSQEIGWCEQFSWTCRSFTENFRWLKPATQTCGWTFSPLFHPISFIYKDKSILRRPGSTSFAIWIGVLLIKFKGKAKFFSHLLWSSDHRRLKFLPNFGSLWNFLQSVTYCWLHPSLRNGYRWRRSSRSKDSVFYS